MREKVNSPVTVSIVSDCRSRKIYPLTVDWGGRRYRVRRIGMRHSYRQGRVLYHVFSVVAGGTFFRLALNTESLLWEVQEVADGNPD